LDDYKKAAETFNQRAEVCKKNGIRFAYHNHDYSFVQFDGQFPQDIMMSNTNPDTVDFEMDIYWVVTAGQDPIAWLEKYPNRFRLGHLKDRQAGVAPSVKDASVELGKGGINFKQILASASKNGMKHFIVEQEKYEGTTPIKAAQADADYMKNFRLA
jgi:sugar phosphate isomerase/epimerase